MESDIAFHCIFLLHECNHFIAKQVTRLRAKSRGVEVFILLPVKRTLKSHGKGHKQKVESLDQ